MEKHHTCKEDNEEISVLDVGGLNPYRENPRSQTGTENPIHMHWWGSSPGIEPGSNGGERQGLSTWLPLNGFNVDFGDLTISIIRHSGSGKIIKLLKKLFLHLTAHYLHVYNNMPTGSLCQILLGVKFLAAFL